MVTKHALQHRLSAAETQEPDRAWFAQRPARTHRMRLPTFDDLLDYGTKTTHVIVARRGVKQLSRMPITLPTNASPFHVGLLMKDTSNDGVHDLALTGLMHAIRGGRRINLEEILMRASNSFR
jgi:hypothetical protein